MSMTLASIYTSNVDTGGKFTAGFTRCHSKSWENCKFAAGANDFGTQFAAFVSYNGDAP
jgi:hypothetical protein